MCQICLKTFMQLYSSICIYMQNFFNKCTNIGSFCTNIHKLCKTCNNMQKIGKDMQLYAENIMYAKKMKLHRLYML